MKKKVSKKEKEIFEESRNTKEIELFIKNALTILFAVKKRLKDVCVVCLLTTLLSTGATQSSW